MNICPVCKNHSGFRKNGIERTYCSFKCHMESRKKGIIKNCLMCSKPIYACKSEIHKKKFCSCSCRAKFNIDKLSFKKIECKKTRRKYKWLFVDKRFIKESRYIMEKHLGRTLGTKEIVHHINNDPLDNRIENLLVMEWGDHSRLTCKENRNSYRK